MYEHFGPDEFYSVFCMINVLKVWFDFSVILLFTYRKLSSPSDSGLFMMKKDESDSSVQDPETEGLFSTDSQMSLICLFFCVLMPFIKDNLSFLL